MRYFLTLLFAVQSFVIHAQSVCKIYQSAAGDTVKKRLVYTGNMNEFGRIEKEVVRGYTLYLNNTSTMYSCREDGRYEYYYDDTVLYKMVFTELDDLTHTGVDSNKVFYYYQDSNTLIKEVRVKHLKKRMPGQKPGSFRNTITCNYDTSGNLICKNGAYGDFTREFLSYDELGRLITDSVRTVTGKEDFCMVSKYEYTYDGYREYSWMCDRKYPVITVFRLDEQKRIVEQAAWYHMLDDKGGTRKSQVPTGWNKYFNNDLSKYKQKERTVTRYDEKGRKAETKFYYFGKHTTTHTFVYE